MIRESTNLLGTLVSLQPVMTTGGGKSNEDRVLELAADMEEKVPPTIDLDATKKNLKGDSSPLNVVLFQEIERYALHPFIVQWGGNPKFVYLIAATPENGRSEPVIKFMKPRKCRATYFFLSNSLLA